MFEKIKEVLNLKNIPNEKIRKSVERIPWEHTFLLEAILWSNRSHDAETKCGCVITRNNTILSTGYNGFIRGIDDSALPNVRNFKYDFMIHAEHNAILNCVRNGISTIGSTIYITGQPCNWCLQYMWQAGIQNIVYTDYSQPKMVQSKEQNRIRKALLILMGNKMSFQFIPMKEIL